MANESLISNSSDVRLTEAMAGEYQLILADRFSLYGHDAFVYAGNCAEKGSNVLKVPLLGLNGYDRLSSVAENASVANTGVTDSHVLITVSRHALQREISDLNNMVDNAGLNVEALIADGVGAYTARWTELACSLLNGFSNTASPGSGIAFDFTSFLTAKFTLIQNSVPGPYLWIGYGKQLTDLLTDLRGEVGPVQLSEDAQAVFKTAGVGFHGSLAGVQLVTSSLVPSHNGGADSAGAMMGRGAIAYGDGTPGNLRGGSEFVIQAGQKLWTELARDASGALTKVVHSAYLGFSELEDLRGVTTISDR